MQLLQRLKVAAVVVAVRAQPMARGLHLRRLLGVRVVRVVMSTLIHPERLVVLLVVGLVVREQQRAAVVAAAVAKPLVVLVVLVVQAQQVQKFLLRQAVRQVRVVAAVVAAELRGKAARVVLVASTGVVVVQVALEQTTATVAMAHKAQFGSPTRLQPVVVMCLSSANGWSEHDDEGDDDIDQGRAEFSALDEIEAAL